MLTAIKYKKEILENFYLDEDDITIRRKRDDDVKGKFKKHDIVKPYSYKNHAGMDYKGVHIPGTRRTISLPWLYAVLRDMPIKDGSVIDHLDGDISNNSRENLRIVDQATNCKNRAKPKNNTSGYTGLSFHKPSGRWVARKAINGKRVWRSSKNFDEALKMLKELEYESLQCGYTKRHGCEKGSTTIESTSMKGGSE